MQTSISIDCTPSVKYLLRIGDTCLIHAQRISEWSGHAPILEEDIALSNMALDLIGQTRAVLTLAGQLEGKGHDEDQLAYLRSEQDYFNLTMVELPRGDFAFTVVRNVMVATLLKLLWERLCDSEHAELAAIAGKAIKEARYHQQHAADWLIRLGDSTAEARQRAERALQDLWLYVPEFFEADHNAASGASNLGPDWSEVKVKWHAEMHTILQASTLSEPEDRTFRSTGKYGVHSEHMGYLLAEMQYLQRAYPGGQW